VVVAAAEVVAAAAAEAAAVEEVADRAAVDRQEDRRLVGATEWVRPVSSSTMAACCRALPIWACLARVSSRRVGPLRISSAHASSFRLLLRRISSARASSSRLSSPRVLSGSLPSAGILWIEAPRQSWSAGLSSVQASLLGLWVCVSQPLEFSRCTELVYRVSGAKSVDTKSSLALKAKYNAGRC
jgi:hypothetical protein